MLLYSLTDLSFITARKRSLGQGNIFRSVCQEFCSQTGVVSQHALQVVSQHALHGGSPAPFTGGSWGVWPGGSPGWHPGDLQTHTRGLCIPACTEADLPMDDNCSGWYASYWNAFLLYLVSQNLQFWETSTFYGNALMFQKKNFK